jgi:RNA polymerase sigma-70 factor (ECF subfamily)
VSVSTIQDALLGAALQGDRRAVEKLLTGLLPRVRGDNEVDDIAQEALIAILRGLPTFRGDGSLKSWADRVVVRVTLSSIKKVRKERALRDLGPDLSVLPDPAGRPDEYASRREMVVHLDALPYDQRHALVLHHVLGMSVPEIAEELRTPFETIRSRLRLGQASMRTAMPGHGPAREEGKAKEAGKAKEEGK